MKLTELNDRSLPDFLQKSRTPALVAFTAAWSKPSRAMYPVLEELARQYDSVVEFALVDADSSRNSLNHYGVLSIPTYLYFRNGRVKIELATGKGRKTVDKRHELARREAEREAARAMSRDARNG